jgi:hypothetical protein
MKFIAFAALAAATASSSFASPIAGSWELYPGQSPVYSTVPLQPINADGSSVFNARRGVIPITLQLFSQPGPMKLTSIGTGYSYASFTPSAATRVSDITNLSVVGAFTTGQNTGGSLRWSLSVDVDGDSVSDGHIWVYYGALGSFTGTDISGNIISSANEARIDTSQLTAFGGSYGKTWNQTLATFGTARVLAATAVLDSGWAGDQVIALDSLTLNDNTFAGSTAGSQQVTDLPEAEISITKISGANPGVVNEVVSVQGSDSGTLFRIVNGQYKYNLDTSCLSGAGTYQVRAVINGISAGGSVLFSLK